ncbi:MULTISPECIES: hypothetical protein [Vibrio]|jgi:hypothetical protein|uniref:Uncharacterized protein n=2 Tax=Vibrio splendidus TaxID=29497 RepID=A0ABV4LN00_VIBSP|nr:MULTISPECIES: hypothetical protein [Vibrio]KPM01121.1 hypothetical protein AN167_04895 [Vibrio splendidus]MBB1465746.1 hypothetical protein [Vibrio sp. SG41-7]MCC4859563.1 hypothetical protein [Vibrio splendidus]MCW4441652.1 hypothetical protein [Vibrio splendidus]MDH5886131.1 hypothetical protein [Vibrio splendidus]
MVGIMLQSPDELFCVPTFLQELSSISQQLGESGYYLLINSSINGDSVQNLNNFVSHSLTWQSIG